MSGNPLLEHGRVPRFADIRAEHVQPAIAELIARQDAALATLERELAPTWAGLIERFRVLAEPLGFAWGVINHLIGVRNSPELRTAHAAVQGDVVAASMRLGQSAPVYQGLKQLLTDHGATLDAAQRRAVEGHLRDGELAGIALTGAARERFNALAVELSDLGTRYQNHLLDANKAFALDLTQAAEVEGLPATTRALAAQTARAAGLGEATPEQGPWRITLDFPLYGPFMEHARRRDLRERLYRAYSTRASTGELDNRPLLARILAARREQAQLLGFSDYAALSLAQKMAGTASAVAGLLDQLRLVAKPAAARELADLQAFARSVNSDPAFTLRHWDIGFYAERQREQRFAYSEEELRPYFPFPRVLDGLFALAKRLFAIDIAVAADGRFPLWHPEVRAFTVSQDGREIAAFYLDAFSRPAEKRGGAWMDVCLDRCRDARGLRLPIAHLVCNQAPPVDGRPSLMSFREVETLFHEFGHGLQHLLTTVDHPEVAGIARVEWDAVELPSQFMENWCFHRATLRDLSAHVDTGEPLPDRLFERITAARTYRSGSMTLRQVAFSTVDLVLHRLPEGADIEVAVATVWHDNSVLLPLPEDRFLCAFSHIFAGGYAAGYYSYKWAEVLSADAFAAFEDAGLDDAAAVSATGGRFRATVLALGGSRHPAEIYRDFRGREPSVAALLRHTGLAA